MAFRGRFPLPSCVPEFSFEGLPFPLPSPRGTSIAQPMQQTKAAVKGTGETTEGFAVTIPRNIGLRYFEFWHI